MTVDNIAFTISVFLAIFAIMCVIFVIKDDLVDVISSILSYMAAPFFDAEDNIVKEFNHL